MQPKYHKNVKEITSNESINKTLCQAFKESSTQTQPKHTIQVVMTPLPALLQYLLCNSMDRYKVHTSSLGLPIYCTETWRNSI